QYYVDQYDRFFNDTVMIGGKNYSANALHPYGLPEGLFVNLSGNEFVITESHKWRPVFEADYNGSKYTVHSEIQWIYKLIQSWGVPYRWMLEPMEIQNLRSVHNIVLGTPRWGMWGYNVWATDPETGALDLDGDLETTNDQFFVRRIHTGTDTWTSEKEAMWVGIQWDPDTQLAYNELYVDGWMGKSKNSWEWSWSEEFIWYYANTTHSMQKVTQNEFDGTIKPMLIDNETSLPKPGYWDIARMSQNLTSAEMLQIAQDNGWDWYMENKQEWEVLWFDFGQDYWTDWSEDDTLHNTWVNLQYQFAGLLLYTSENDDVMDTDEITHYYIPSHIGDVDFVSPGVTFGDLGLNGTMLLAGTEEINFGVSFSDINGTTYPYNSRSYWSWYQGGSYGSDMQTFDERPVDANVESLEFLVHFFTFEDGKDNDTNYYANMKVDQNVGNWEVDFPGGVEVLENRSLATSYYIYANTGDQYRMLDSTGNETQNDQVTESRTYELAVQNHQFAGVSMGETYDWVKNTSQQYNTSSSTTPIGTFRASFEGESNDQGAMGYNFRSEMYFLTLAFPKWDGYGVFCDPALGLAVGKSQHEGPPGPSDNPFGWDNGGAELSMILIIGGTIASIILVIVVVVKKRRRRTKIYNFASPQPSAQVETPTNNPQYG
ncbi:MAG: hypothetical protein ACTSUV_04010, partial [Candidatus Ranarchaeia archaeon]